MNNTSTVCPSMMPHLSMVWTLLQPPSYPLPSRVAFPIFSVTHTLLKFPSAPSHVTHNSSMPSHMVHTSCDTHKKATLTVLTSLEIQLLCDIEIMTGNQLPGWTDFYNSKGSQFTIVNNKKC